MLSDRGVKYLAERGISVETAVRLELFTARGPDGSQAEPTSSDDANYIGIPYRRGLGVIYTQFRDMRPDVPHKFRYLSPEGSKPAIYNVDVIDGDPGLDGKPLTICEGAMDAIAMIEAGAQRVIAIPGTALVGLVKDAEADFSEIAEIILAGDNDDAGRKMNSDLVDILSPVRCKLLEHPQGCKDVGDILLRGGRSGVIDCLRSAKHMPVGVYKARDVPKRPPLDVMKLRSFGPDFERLIGICKRQISIWTGEPNHGKSGMMKAVVWALMREKNWNAATGFFEEEAYAHTIPDLQRLHCGREPQDDAEANAAFAWIDDHCVFIEAPENEVATLEWAMIQVEAAARRHGADIVVLDPWSQFDIAHPKFSETEMTRRYLIELRNKARDLNIHIAIVAHPRKSGEYGGTQKIADGNDVAGSLHFKGRCDLGVTIQRDPVADGVTNVLVWKVRRREMGRQGVFSLFFHEASGRYSPMTSAELARARGEDEENVVEFGKAAKRHRSSGSRTQQRKDIYE